MGEKLLRRVVSRRRHDASGREQKVHGRPIYHDTAKTCGLPVKLFDSESNIWQIVWTLYVRMNYYVSHHAPKLIESAESRYYSKIPFMDT